MAELNDKNAECIIFKEGIEEISDYAYASFYNLKELVIPDTVKKIGKGAFQNCKNLRNVVLPKGIQELPNNLFLHCPMLEKLEIPDSVLKIGDQVLFGCRMKNITIPKSVVTIGNSAFTGVSEFSIYDGFNYEVNKYNIFTWLSEPIYDRETDGSIPETYDFIKNVVINILDDDNGNVKFKFFIPFRDQFDIFSISDEIFRKNRLDITLLDGEFQRIRDFDNKINYVYYRILYPYKLNDKNTDLFIRFIRSNDKKIAKKIIDDNEVLPFIKFEKLGLVDDKNIDRLIEYANINQKFNSLSYLMNYKNDHFKHRFSI